MGYAFMPEAQVVRNASIITAAAPDLPGGEQLDEAGLQRMIVNIFVTPKCHNPAITTLILGALGCGAFGNDPPKLLQPCSPR